jgi:hypothetical protein
MSDERLRILEKEGRSAPERSPERYRWRLELLRAGKRREAGLEIGDLVAVTGWNQSQRGRVFRLTKTRVKVQVDISPKHCVRPTYRLPAVRDVVLIEPGLGEYCPW